MSRKVRFTGAIRDLDTHHIFDDFNADQSDLFWIDTITDSGTALVGDARKGIMVLTPSDGTVADNDEVYLGSANEVFLILANKPMYAAGYIQFTETAAGVYNAIFGWANAVAADLIVDNGGGPRASGTIICIEKRDGETVWRLTTRNGANVTTTLSTTTAGGASYQKLEIFVEHYTSTQCQVTAKVDGSFLTDSNGKVAVHTMLYASATEMQGCVGAKLGAITNNDVTNVDYLYFSQLR